MSHSTPYFTKTFFIAACLVLGCSGGSTLGCGGGSSTPKVDSNLLGTYQVTSYEGSQTDCTQPAPIDPAPTYLVLYSFVPNGQPDEAWLGGVFCSSLEECADVATRAPEPTIGYALNSGNDASGWVGAAISGTGRANDQCRADIQRHTLTSPSSGSIRIETQTVQVIYPPDPELSQGNDVVCTIRDALDALTPDLPCTAIILVDATLDTTN